MKNRLFLTGTRKNSLEIQYFHITMASILGNIGEIINQTDNAAKTHDIQRIIDWLHCCGKSRELIEQWEKTKVEQNDWYKADIEKTHAILNCKGDEAFKDPNFVQMYLNWCFAWPPKMEMIPYMENDTTTGSLKLMTKLMYAFNETNIELGADGKCRSVIGTVKIFNFKGTELPDFIPFEPGRTHLILIGCPNLNRQKLTMNGIDYEDLGVQ